MKLFFELLQVALGTRTSLSIVPTQEQWEAMYAHAEEQTLVGVCFSGIERLPKEQQPGNELLLQWWGIVRQIEEQNRVMDEKTDMATKYFREEGFKTVILKGQGIAKLYPIPERRQSGDIDVWLRPNGQGKANREEEEQEIKGRNLRQIIFRFVRRNDPKGRLHGVNYHHVHYHLFEDAEVEIHIYPGYLHNPFKNRRLHRFFEKYPLTEEVTPSLAFNRVYILQHTFNHLMGHGVGLRQVMDYYYVLCQGFTADEKAESLEWIDRLGMRRFAGAMMWVLQKAFGMDEQYMLVEPDEQEGRFLLDEISQTGNMGHHDQRNWGSLRTPVSRFLFNLRRDWHFLSHYPQEVLWQPFFSLWLNVVRLMWMNKVGK